MPKDLENFRQDVLSLCSKVTQVIMNNDWPTEEGQMDENGDCAILLLVAHIQRQLE